MRTLFGLGLLLSLAPVSAAEQDPPHGLVVLETSEHSMTLWDAGDLRRDGDHIEVRLLRISVGPGVPLFIYGSIQGVRLSCEWGTIDRYLPAERYDSFGHASETPSEPVARPNPFVQPTFYGPYGWYAHVVAIGCDPNFQVPETALPSVAAAMRLASQTLKPLPPPTNNVVTVQRILPPHSLEPLPGFSSIGPYRFGFVAQEPTSGNMAFLDWVGLRRFDGQAIALTLEVLGDDTPPLPKSSASTIVLRAVHFDCTARTINALGYADFDKAFRVWSQDRTKWPVRSTNHWRLGTALLDTACSAREPASTFASLEDAVAFQRLAHPLRTTNSSSP